MMRTKALCILALSTVSGALLLAAPAFAAPTGDAEHGDGGVNIFAGDVGNIFWTLLIFGLVLLVLGKYAWGPLLDTLQKREDFIRESLASAKADRVAAEQRLKDYEERLTKARAEATAIVEEGRRDAEVLRQRIEQEARAESDKVVERAKREIAIAQETAVKEIYQLSGRLATGLAADIVRRELKVDDHQQLIDDSIARMEQLEQ